MPNIIIPSAIPLWSIQNKIGAPSFYKTVTAYAQKGWKVFLICPSHEQEKMPAIENVTYIPVRIVHSKFFHVKKIGLLFKILSRKVLSKDFYRIIYKLIKNIDLQPTILYAYEIAAVSACKKLSDHYKIPLVTRFQGTILAPIPDTIVQRIRHYPHFGALATPSDLVIMTNDGTQGDRVLQRLGNHSKTLFLRNGVDTISQADTSHVPIIAGVSPSDIIFMTVSRLENWKRVDRAIRGLAAIQTQLPHAKLVIIGQGSEQKNLETLAKELCVSDRVVFTGGIPHEQVVNYLIRADIFLSFYDLSNVGNPLLEAMQCGKPIITLDEGDTDTVITDGENGLLLSKPYEETIPSAMLHLAQDDTLASNLSTNARNWAKNNLLSWEERMDIEVNAVSNLLKKEG